MSKPRASEDLAVTAIQMRVDEAESSDDRVAAAAAAVRAEAKRGADLVILPEMWLPGYFAFDRYASVAEPIDGPTAASFGLLAKECGVTLCAGSMVERRGDRLHNTTIVFDEIGDLVAAYRKIHLFGYGSKEQELLSPGDEVVTFPWRGLRVGVSTCYDLRFPELYRAQVDAGAEAFLVVAGWPFPRLDAWRCLARARAIENQAALVACNAAGRHGASTFLGASCAFDAWGTSLGELSERPDVLRFELGAEAIRAARAEFPALSDRVLGRDR